MPDSYFVSQRKQGFDLLLDGAPTPSGAVATIRGWERSVSLPSATIYVSTAITSGGFVRVSGMTWADAKARNEQCAGRLYGALIDSSILTTPTNGMVPTELGKVPGWTDTDFLTFYFAYAAGLAADACVAFEEGARTCIPSDVRTIADNRNLSNDERWPDYLRVVEMLLGQLDRVRTAAEAVEHPPLQVMLQLVDTGYSLGCRAEKVYAEHEQMDVLRPAIQRSALTGTALGDDIALLDSVPVETGTTAAAVVPVPAQLNSLRTST